MTNLRNYNQHHHCSALEYPKEIEVRKLELVGMKLELVGMKLELVGCTAKDSTCPKFTYINSFREFDS